MKRDEQIRMLLHPEDYTDEQMDQMLDEADIPVPDAEEEWQRFKTQSTSPAEDGSIKTSSPLEGRRVAARRWMRVAAAFIGVLMLSGIAYAAFQIVRSQETGSRSQETVAAASAQRSMPDAQLAQQDSTQQKPVVFEDAELATILSEIATFHQCEVVYKKEESKHIRLYFTWDKKSSLDEIVGTFNKFERIHITRENKKLIVE